MVQRSELQTVTSQVLFVEMEQNLGSSEPERVWAVGMGREYLVPGMGL